ncbi:MAG TPA: GtrA family protein [Polyangiaceae bacterium]|jgi:putative flippase GtrA|nr:GtrA family protein [Polyangiaceae bacterium]
MPSPAVFARSAMVGLVATALDFGILSLLVSGFGVSARLASLPALAVGIVVQFVGNKQLAFRDASPDWLKQAGLFLAVEGFGLLSNLVVFDRLLVWTPLPYLLCRILSTAFVYYALCLPLWARIFSQASASAESS